MTDGDAEKKLNALTEQELEVPQPEVAPEVEEERGEAVPKKAPAPEREIPAAATETKIQITLPPLKKIKPIPQIRDEVAIKIEKILENGLADSYARLSPIAQQEFKLKGEQTALKIRELLEATKIKVKNIFRLILDWLKMLPGVNRFFLEQEAKIKTDRILALKEPPAE